VRGPSSSDKAGKSQNPTARFMNEGEIMAEYRRRKVVATDVRRRIVFDALTSASYSEHTGVGRARCPQRAAKLDGQRRAGDSAPYPFAFHPLSRLRIRWNPRRRLRFIVHLLLALTFFVSSARAVTFTTNSYIGI